MSKISNTLSLLRILENGNVVKIKDLAEMLECSERSVRTYKADLEKSGIYIESISGRYGGYYYISNKKNEYFNIDKNDLNIIENAYLRLLNDKYKDINSLNRVLDKIRYLVINSKENENSGDKNDNQFYNTNFSYISNYINKDEMIEFNYKNKKITFKPQNLYVYNGICYVTGINCNIKQIRTYNLSDINIIK